MNLLHQLVELLVILDPRTFLLLGGVVESLRTTKCLDVEVGDPGALVGAKRNANFMVTVQHEVVFEQSGGAISWMNDDLFVCEEDSPSLTVVDADHPLLHPHLVWSSSP